MSFPKSWRRGFTLIEILVVIAIVAVIAGIAMPVVATTITRAKVDETRLELRAIVPALQQYFWDCRRLPTTLAQLQVNSPAVTGWKGPYITALVSNKPGVNVSLDQDAWNNAYILAATAEGGAWSPTTATNQVIVRSRGPDGTANNADDLVETVSVIPMRRKETVDELNIINNAITAYNAINLPGTPLSTSVETLFGQLYTANLLPRPPVGTTDPLRTDGWGNAYTLSMTGVSPPIRVISSNVGNAGSPPSGG